MSELMVVAHIQSQIGHSIRLDIVVTSAVGHTQSPVVPKAKLRVCTNAMQQRSSPVHHWFVLAGSFPDAVNLLSHLQVVNTEQETNLAQVNTRTRVLHSRSNVCQRRPFTRWTMYSGKKIAPAFCCQTEFLGSPDRAV
jgi:hypothetical protein